VTASLCLWCGATKGGALNDCPECSRAPVDYEVSVQFTDHYFTRVELSLLATAVRVIGDLKLEDEGHVYSFLYFVSRKWPKVLESDLDGLPQSVAAVASGVYRSHLSDLEGQSRSRRVMTPWEERSWDQSSSHEFADQERQWNRQLRPLLVELHRLLRRTEQLGLRLGLGGILSKLASWWGRLTARRDPLSWTARVDALGGDWDDLSRQVLRAREPVKNGWSRRSQERITYLNGAAEGLRELIDLAARAAAHREGRSPMIRLDLRRLGEEWRQRRGQLRATLAVVEDPELIVDPLTKSLH